MKATERMENGGQKIVLKVKIQDGTYEKDGSKVYKTRFTAEEIELIPLRDKVPKLTTEDLPF
jgi:hypothetical protein